MKTSAESRISLGGKFMRKASYLLVGAALASVWASAASAGTILIINGSSTTSETGTTASITTQLTNLHTAVGNVVTVVDSVPVDISSYSQVWDIRFFNAAPITAPVQTQYLNYLAGGGGMFVMGENAGFMTRNNSVLALIAAAGGGNLSFVTPASTQTVFAPFDGPNAVTDVTYLAPGGVNGFGTGQWITANGGSGTGVAWAKGTLANAQAGALTTIFDVNFMQLEANEGSQALTRNLIQFVGGQVNAVPEPTTWALMILGFGLVGGAMRRSRPAVSLTFA
jgi:hypothetical protein